MLKLIMLQTSHVQELVVWLLDDAERYLAAKE
jgi:hypothetical protein